MSRNEFMRQLESLLQNISLAEREEALQYYNDYFDDAGAENEQAVIEALGNPARVAENIKKDLLANGYGDAVDVKVTANDRAVMTYGTEDGQNNVPPDFVQTESTERSGISNGWLILIILLCVLAAPAILGVAGGVVGAVIGIVAAWFALIFGFGVTAVSLLAVFVILLVVAVICAVTDPLVAVALLGGGMICGGVGILFLMLTVAMAGIATPAAVKGIAALCRKLFGGKKESTAV